MHGEVDLATDERVFDSLTKSRLPPISETGAFLESIRPRS